LLLEGGIYLDFTSGESGSFWERSSADLAGANRSAEINSAAAAGTVRPGGSRFIVSTR